MTGALKSPDIAPDPKQLGIKAALAVVTGLISTIQLGLGNDNDCAALLETAQKEAASPPQVPMPPPHPAAGSQPKAPRGR